MTRATAGQGQRRHGSHAPEVIGVRRGMFGAKGSGDTSGYGRLVRPVALPGSTPRPYGGYFDEVVDTLAPRSARTAFAAAVERVVVFRDELTLEVRREHLLAVAQALRDDPALRFELCLGVSGVHYPDDTDRELHAVYPSCRSPTTVASGWRSPRRTPIRTSRRCSRVPDHRLA